MIIALQVTCVFCHVTCIASHVCVCCHVDDVLLANELVDPLRVLRDIDSHMGSRLHAMDILQSLHDACEPRTRSRVKDSVLRVKRRLVSHRVFAHGGFTGSVRQRHAVAFAQSVRHNKGNIRLLIPSYMLLHVAQGPKACVRNIRTTQTLTL